jgi:hypothetical protein
VMCLFGSFAAAVMVILSSSTGAGKVVSAGTEKIMDRRRGYTI